MLKILYVMRNIRGGGNSKRFWMIHKVLVNRELKVTLLATPDSGVGQKFDNTSINSDGIRIISLRLPRSFTANYLFYIKATRVVKSIASEFDVVHDDFSPTVPYSFLWCDNAVATVHEVFGVNAIRRYGIAGWVPLINERFYRRMRYKAFITCSPSMARELRKLGVNNVVVIPLGVDTELFKPKPSLRNRNNVVISMVSRFVPVKGHIFFLKIAKQLARKHKDVKFILPSTGPLLPKMRNLANELNLPIQFPGFLEDDEEVVRILQASDIYVHTSLQEGFGISVCEAMACQLPVVAFDVPGVRELVTPECGFLVSPKNVEEAVDAVTRLIEDDSLRHEFGLKARKRVLNYFTWCQAARRMLEVYRRFSR